MAFKQNITLVSKLTGQRFDFRTMREANSFLGRGIAYINNMQKCGLDPSDANTGEYFYVIKTKVEGTPHSGSQYKNTQTGQLCTTCARASGFCSWSQELIPVEGWHAKPTMIKHMNNKGDNVEEKTAYTNSYRIYACPLYIQDGKTPLERKIQRMLLMEELENG